MAGKEKGRFIRRYKLNKLDVGETLIQVEDVMIMNIIVITFIQSKSEPKDSLWKLRRSIEVWLSMLDSSPSAAVSFKLRKGHVICRIT